MPHAHASLLSLRPATTEDAAELSAFAARVFVETFGKDNTVDDMNAYVRSAFSTELQAREIADVDALELKRFYVAKEWQGCGLANTLMLEIVRHAKARGARTLWLGVWEHNARALAFYRKRGFREVGSHPFLLGSDPQTDLLMSVSLD